jgi:DNA-binding GntR family transcriptional regulator
MLFPLVHDTGEGRAVTATTTKTELQSDAAYLELRALIENGRLEPGSRIVEAEIVERFGVSRPTVRTALQKLHADGLLVRPDGASSRWAVPPLTIADVREVALIMGALEGEAARRVAALPPKARRGIAAELRTINDEIRMLASADPLDIARLADLGGRFHRTLVETSGLPRLIDYCDSLRAQVRRYVSGYLAYVSHRGSTSVDEHDAIIRAVRHGDEDGAEAAVRVNWRGSADRYADAMERVGERGVW